MSEPLLFSSYPVFRALPELSRMLDRKAAAEEADALFERYRPEVTLRGAYSTAGFRASADLMLWCVAESADVLQDLIVDFRRTGVGRALVQTEAFLGLVRPAEFARDHQPAFAKGEPPKRYVCVYPFVRTPEWYLLEPKERGRMLQQHGELALDYKDVLANTTSAFGLGDYEWILAFEADGLDRIVDLIRALRAADARRYTGIEIPFVTGVRKELHEVIADLP